MEPAFAWLTDTTGFVPRKSCGDWSAAEVAVHVVSDLLIWLAYLSIPLVLVYFARRRRGLPFSWLAVLFAAFILACGTTHLIEAVIFYHPLYHLSGVVKAVTAVVSWLTVLALVPAVPKLLDLTAAAARSGEAVPTAPPAAPRWRGYLAALAAAAVAVFARLALDPILGSRYPYLIAFLVVVYVAWEAGLGPTMLCTALVGTATELWFVEPRGELFTGDLADRVAFGLFLFSGLGTGILGEAQRQARERAEAALAAAGERQAELDRERAVLDTLFETSPAGLALFGGDGRFLRVNTALAGLHGLPPSALVGQPGAAAGPGFAAAVEPAVRRVADRGRPELNQEVRLVPAGDPGREHVCLASYYPVPGAAGERPGVGLVLTDITDRKRADDDLRRSEERYRLATEAVRGLVYDADHAAARVERSGGMFDLIGVRPEDADPAEGWWTRHVHPDDRPGLAADVNRATARGAPTFQTEYRVRHADGRWVWVEDRARVMYGADGKPRRVVGCRTDATARKEAEARLRDSEARFRTLAEAVPVAVWVCRPDGTTEYMNARWEGATGAPPAASLGNGWLNQVHPDDRPRAAAAWAAAVADPDVGYRTEYRLCAPAGGYRWYLAVGYPYRDGTGAVVRWFGTCTDIDDRKRQADTLEKLVADRTAELVRSNRELEEFAYAASHDLQEPLRKIQTYATRLRDKGRDQLDDENRDRLDRMMGSAGRMTKLIEDLLAYSRITSRARAFAPADLNAVLADALEDLAARVEQTGGTVTAGPLPTVPADPGQMRQVFQNLIGNALKFHRPGVPPAVAVSAARTPGGWELTVADNGIGFEDRHAAKIFQVFQRLHGREAFDGTGIGLAVCKKIVDRHGGTIAARGRPGEGATFVVTLPARDEPDR